MNRSPSLLASIVGKVSVACGAVASLVPLSLLLIVLFDLPAGNMVGVSALMVGEGEQHVEIRRNEYIRFRDSRGPLQLSLPKKKKQ